MIRLLFNRLNTREKGLLVAFLWVMLLIWASSLFDNTTAFVRNWSETGRSLEAKEAIIELGPQVEAALEEQFAVLNPALTLDENDLAGKVDTIARRLGVQFVLSPMAPERIQDFDIYKLRIQIRRAPLDQLLAFNEAILSESPYMKMENIRLSADAMNPTLHNASFVINSFEFQPEESTESGPSEITVTQ